MIRSDMMRSVSLGVLVTFACLEGCDKDWAKHVEYGRAIPDMRFTVTLADPLTRLELFQRFEQLAHMAGFSNYIGVPISPERLESDPPTSTFSWSVSEATGWGDYNISFYWQPHAVVKPSSFVAIFRNGRVDDFTIKEWLIFKNWKDSYLPKVFPDATIEVTRHPAAFTDEKQLLEISMATGIEIPAKYLAFLKTSP